MSLIMSQPQEAAQSYSDKPIAGISVTIDQAEDLYSQEEMNILYHIVEAEMTGQEIDCKKNVASVILNRVENEEFPDTIKKVVFQKSQFSPIGDGRYWDVHITKETKQAVKEVLVGGPTTKALYFANISDVESPRLKHWFNSLTDLGTDSSGTHYYIN